MLVSYTQGLVSQLQQMVDRSSAPHFTRDSARLSQNRSFRLKESYHLLSSDMSPSQRRAF